MSVLSFPRIYFKGFMEWDPCTFNNNDWQAFPTYDPVNADLNWSFLAQKSEQVPTPITPDNFTTAFRPWAITLLPEVAGTPPDRIPAEWNMFGTHGVSFGQYGDYTTTIIGGDVGNGYLTSDPLIGSPVSISGDDANGPGRLVDTNPASPWSSQIYFGQLQFGGDDSSISGPRTYRMHSRWLNPFRIFDNNNPLDQPAASIGVCFQTCIPFNEVTWNNSSNSQLITALQQAAMQPGAQGIMMRFTAYVNVYFVNGIFNGITAQPRNYEELATALAAAWDAWNLNGDASQFFSNPCYSHVVGVVGVWNEGELATVPGGRCLAAGASVFPNGTSDVASTAPAQPLRFIGRDMKPNIDAVAGSAVPLGPVAVNIDYTNGLISLDMSATIPENGTPGEWPSDLSKANFGTLSLGVVTSENAFTSIAKIGYDQYAQAAYEASAGIIDIPFPNSGTGALLQSGTLAIQVEDQSALVEQVFTAETDTRGIYLDENESSNFDVTVFVAGQPGEGSNLMVAQYDKTLTLVSVGHESVLFTNGNQEPITVPNGTDPPIKSNVSIFATDQSGSANVSIVANNPGFPVLAFFPYYPNDPQPQPPASFNFTDSAFYTTVRVLPFDDAVPQEFVDLWNSTQDPEQAWAFIYGLNPDTISSAVLYVYDMLFNVMLEFVDLGSQQAVESSISGIWSAISQESAQESTYAMPITRDMSAGKRKALQLWIYLVANGYKVPNFNVDSIPPGWSPPST